MIVGQQLLDILILWEILIFLQVVHRHVYLLQPIIVVLFPGFVAHANGQTVPAVQGESGIASADPPYTSWNYVRFMSVNAIANGDQSQVSAHTPAGFVIGSAALWFSADGNSWELTSPNTNFWSALIVGSGNTVLAIGSGFTSNNFALSTDGGQTWNLGGNSSMTYFPISPQLGSLGPITFYKANTWFGSDFYFSSGPINLYKSPESDGMNWSSSLSLEIGNTSGGGFANVFYNAARYIGNTIYVAGSDLGNGVSVIWKSSDNGNTWSLKTFASSNAINTPVGWRMIGGENETIIYGVNLDGYLYYTIDQADSWIESGTWVRANTDTLGAINDQYNLVNQK